MAPNCTLKANLKRPISQATKSEVRPFKLINKKDLGWQALQKRIESKWGGPTPSHCPNYIPGNHLTP